MSDQLPPRRVRFPYVAILVCLVLAIVPAAAQASPVLLGTTQPFVVLGGAGVTNTGASVLNGDLGVSPQTSLTGFSAPAVVNGATHDNDAVAAQAQADLTTAYNVAAGQPVPPGNNLTGTNLGGRTLDPGAYGFSSSAELTGQLTLDAHGDPNAQFVFVIGSTLITESASSVILVNGASPCNVFWKVGSSATFGTTTAFEGNVMALTSITLNNGVTVLGRMLASNGAITLDTDVLTAPQCATGTTSSTTETGTGGSGTTTTTPVASTGGKKKSPQGSAAKTGGGTATLARGKTTAGGVTATVNGKKIKKVVFTDNGVRVANTGPRTTNVARTPGVHNVVARVIFKGSTKSRTLHFTFRVPTPVLHPHHGPSQFTG
jgi:hypothetical protein